MLSSHSLQAGEGLRPAIQQITDHAIDAMLGGPKPGEIVNALALPVPRW